MVMSFVSYFLTKQNFYARSNIDSIFDGNSGLLSPYVKRSQQRSKTNNTAKINNDVKL